MFLFIGVFQVHIQDSANSLWYARIGLISSPLRHGFQLDKQQCNRQYSRWILDQRYVDLVSSGPLPRRICY